MDAMALQYGKIGAPKMKVNLVINKQDIYGFTGTNVPRRKKGIILMIANTPA